MTLVKKFGIAIVSLIWLQATAIACDMHGSFGFSPLAGTHPMLRDFRPKAPVVPIKLSHPAVTSVEANASSKVALRYTAPEGATNMKIELNCSSDLRLGDDTSIVLANNLGQYDLAFVANAAGQHNIDVVFSADINGKPSQLKRTIRVFARDHQQLSAVTN